MKSTNANAFACCIGEDRQDMILVDTERSNLKQNIRASNHCMYVQFMQVSCQYFSFEIYCSD